jgi:hypothetical protein
METQVQSSKQFGLELTLSRKLAKQKVKARVWEIEVAGHVEDRRSQLWQ